MNYNNLTLTWKNGSYWETDTVYSNSYSKLNFISKYLSSFTWNDLGFYYLEDVEAEIKENTGDEDYEPPIDLELFKQLNTSAIVVNGVEIFPEENFWSDFESYISYLKKLDIEIRTAVEFNSYEIIGNYTYKVVELVNEDDGDYNFISDIIYELKADGKLEEELEEIQHDKEIRNNSECLKAVSSVLKHHGYTIKEI